LYGNKAEWTNVIFVPFISVIFIPFISKTIFKFSEKSFALKKIYSYKINKNNLKMSLKSEIIFSKKKAAWDITRLPGLRYAGFSKSGISI